MITQDEIKEEHESTYVLTEVPQNEEEGKNEVDKNNEEQIETENKDVNFEEETLDNQENLNKDQNLVLTEEITNE